jgi:hypothetical protein
MDSNQLSLDESIKQVMQTLPPVIREYLAKGKYTPVAQGLMSKYSLRIDQGGILERELMLLLMGIETPEEFVQALGEEAKIAPEAVGNIVQDINTQIFIPLREEERRGPVEKLAPKPLTPSAPPPAPMISAQNPIVMPGAPKVYAPPLQSPMYPGQPTPEPNITFKRPIQTPSQPSSARTVGEQFKAPAGPQMTDPSKLLEDHEEPHITVGSGAQPAPRYAPPPSNLPGTMPPSQPQAQKPVSPPPAPSYSVDPYREPVDEQ